MNIGDKAKTEFFVELCCEYCNDAEHNHFKCPVCKNDYAGTDIYGWLHEDKEEDGTIEFECEECGSKFKIINYKYGLDEEVEYVGGKTK